MIYSYLYVLSIFLTNCFRRAHWPARSQGPGQYHRNKAWWANQGLWASRNKTQRESSFNDRHCQMIHCWQYETYTIIMYGSSHLLSVVYHSIHTIAYIHAYVLCFVMKFDGMQRRVRVIPYSLQVNLVKSVERKSTAYLPCQPVGTENQHPHRLWCL